VQLIRKGENKMGNLRKASGFGKKGIKERRKLSKKWEKENKQDSRSEQSYMAKKGKKYTHHLSPHNR